MSVKKVIVMSSENWTKFYNLLSEISEDLDNQIKQEVDSEKRFTLKMKRSDLDDILLNF